ncbi:KH domain-containing protein [Tumidithrix elongata RA019]|uniref:KH domain-containing protein n=1 Tax=Tumidithrix elongata BACA0141 TaxID=2716417 RepID=A0AAW9PP01_9CYAN|nr:KH domain-containing protein [Tumidithrix elongata RA019]
MPDYIALTKFLVQPLLDNPDALRIDCETNAKGDRIWVRLAFAPEDKGRAFGRGGRTIQAIRALVLAAAQTTGQELRFDVYDPNPSDKSFDKPSDRERSSNRESSSRNREDRNGEEVKRDRPRIPGPVKRNQVTDNPGSESSS